jgi:hypothetical protein
MGPTDICTDSTPLTDICTDSTPLTDICIDSTPLRILVQTVPPHGYMYRQYPLTDISTDSTLSLLRRSEGSTNIYCTLYLKLL